MTVLSEERVASGSLLAVSFPQPRGGGRGLLFWRSRGAPNDGAAPHKSCHNYAIRFLTFCRNETIRIRTTLQTLRYNPSKVLAVLF